jgi:hypothetical protein
VTIKEDPIMSLVKYCLALLAVPALICIAGLMPAAAEDETARFKMSDPAQALGPRKAAQAGDGVASYQEGAGGETRENAAGYAPARNAAPADGNSGLYAAQVSTAVMVNK